MNISNKKNKGFSLVEVLVVCALISVVISAFVSVASKSIQLSERSLKQTEANFLIEEGVEAVKSIRDDGWSNISSLSLNTNYQLFYNTSDDKWVLSSTDLGTEYMSIDSDFTRVVYFESVERDSSSDDISNSGSTYEDDGTRLVTVTVYFNSSYGVINKSINFYISNIFE